MSETDHTDRGLRRAGGRAHRATFTGREAELARLEGHLDLTASGEGGIVLLAGEAGVGKTALAQQLAVAAGARGGTVLLGRCRGSGAGSYAPVVEALAAHAAQRDAEELRASLGAGAGALARLLPELTERLGLQPVEAAGPEEERFRLFEAVAALLGSAPGPVLLVLDDLQDADAGTVMLVGHLTRALDQVPLLLVGTYRDDEVDRDHPLSAVLAEAHRGARFEEIRLRGLDTTEVAHMIEALTGALPPSEFATAVRQRTEGNALFVQELIRAAVEDGLVGSAQGHWADSDQLLAAAVPAGLRHLIESRLARLRPRARELLSVAAVIGRTFDPATVRAVTQADDEVLFAALEEAVEAALIEERQQLGVAGYAFAHELFQRALYDGLIAPRRIRLHQQIATAIEEAHPDRRDEHAAALAEHFAHSSERGDLAKAVHYGRSAAARAAALYDYGAAARLLERAIEVQKVLDPRDHETGCELLLELGEALLDADEPQRVESEVAEQVFRIAEEAGDAERAARACVMGIDGLPAIEGLPDIESDRGRLWTDRIWGCAQDGTASRIYADLCRAELHREELPELLPRAIAQARQADDPDCLQFVACVTFAFEAFDEMAVRSGFAEDLARRGPSRARARYLSGGQFHLGISRVRLGDREGAEEALRGAIALREVAPGAAVLRHVRTSEVVLAALDGRLEEAVDLGFDFGTSAAAGAFWRPMLGYLAFPLIQLGRVEEYVQRAGGDASRNPFVLALTGESVGARSALASARATPPRLSGQVLQLLRTAVLLGDRDAVRELTELTVAAWRPVGTPWLTVTDRHLGDAYAFLGDVDAARERYEAALTLAEEMRWRPEIALAHLALAELLVTRGHAGNTEAQAHLELAVPELGAMRMQPDLVRALGLRTGRVEFPDGLTPREVEVLRLVAAGRSNQGIAAELTISVNTVTRHLTHIFTKTGTANRAEAASYAVRQGLAS